MREVVDMSVENGVAESSRFAECDVTVRELKVIVTTLNWACQYANKESVEEIEPIVHKIKSMAGL